jgi:hypothetical protein
MATRYELWDGQSGNALGDYATELEALTVIRDTVSADGRHAVATFALLRVNGRGRSQVVAEGDALAERAQRADYGGYGRGSARSARHRHRLAGADSQARAYSAAPDGNV